MGRITSRDQSLNEYGVPYARVLELEREAHRRHVQALTKALEGWVDLEKTRRRNPTRVTEQLYREALKQSEKALG